jgi:hypothetical protein
MASRNLCSAYENPIRIIGLVAHHDGAAVKLDEKFSGAAGYAV